MSTEWNLENWRKGQVAAERMCLQLLSMEGFTDLDPQCPLGGPDGRKDILCTKNGWKYVAAAYFPTEKLEKTKEIKDKFLHDLEGVKTNKVDGIVFITGQKLSPGERKELSEAAGKSGAKDIIYHQERIIGLLDSPLGFAARLEFLGIPMRPEEQIAFVLALRGTHDQGIKDALNRVEGKVDQLLVSSASISNLQLKAFEVLATMATVGDVLTQEAEVAVPQESKDKPASGNLDVEMLCRLHQALMFERFKGGHSGSFRKVNVWIGAVGEPRETAKYVPPPPDKVPGLVAALLHYWNDGFVKLKAANQDQKVDAITKFHLELLNIHPFLDGNGTLSRFLVQQQAQELGIAQRDVRISERAAHAKALAKAQAGDIQPLRSLIYQAITGREPSN